MAKVLKNTTASPIDLNYFGVQIPASTSYTVPPQDYLLLATTDAITEITSYINAGTIIVNNGTVDITDLTFAVNFLRFPDTANRIEFNNASNGFTSKNAQSAIEEARYAEIYQSVSATSLQQTTSATFATLNDMTINAATTGRYRITFSADPSTTGVNGSGEWQVYVNGSAVADSLRGLSTSIVILGLLTLSVNVLRAPINIVTEANITAGQTVEIRWRSTNGVNVQTRGRFFTIQRIG